jgi:c-di-GMP-binding flagellar brake protein YcgR
MDILCGSKVLVEFPTFGDRLKGDMVGGLRNEYLIVALPLVAGIRDRCREGNLLTFRYMSEGAIVGFRSSVIQYLVKPYSLLFIEYPKRLEEHQLRRSKRVSCSFPATLKVGDRAFKGVIVDISSGGCQFFYESSIKRAVAGLEPGMAAQGEFSLLDKEACYPFCGQLASIKNNHGLVRLGLRFNEEQGDLDHRVKGYIEEVCRLLKG